MDILSYLDWDLVPADAPDTDPWPALPVQEPPAPAREWVLAKWPINTDLYPTGFG